MCEVLQHSWYLEDLWYIRTQSNRLLKHSILMVWRIETMRGVLGTVGSMFSQICHFNVKNLEFFLKILYPLFFFNFGPSYVCICHSALMVPFQMCNCTAPDALTHRERHRIYPGGHDAHVFQKEFHISDHRAVFQFLRHHFFIMFLYDLIFLWPSINLKKKKKIVKSIETLDIISVPLWKQFVVRFFVDLKKQTN